MAEHNTFGKEAEEMAVKWLTENGYQVLHRNWRHKQFEIDIIALKDEFLHIVEVKARHFSPFGHPEDSVRKKKFKNLQRATDEFLYDVSLLPLPVQNFSQPPSNFQFHSCLSRNP